MPTTNDQAIADILKRVKTIALVGASHKTHRPSYKVMNYLLENGYTVFPVNPMLSGRELLGQKVYGSLSDIPENIDMIDVFRNASFLRQIVDDAISLKIETIWTQLGVIDDDAIKHAEKNGIEVVVDQCPAIELPRLRQLGLM